MINLYLLELAIFGQIEEKVATTSGLAIVELVRLADPIVKLTILILLLFSVFSWAVMAYKYLSLTRARGSIFEFSRKFWGISNAQELKMLISREANSAARVVVSALKAKEKTGANPSTAAAAAVLGLAPVFSFAFSADTTTRAAEFASREISIFNSCAFEIPQNFLENSNIEPRALVRDRYL